ncbi:PadR family transcriptional regulator [Desulfonatronum thioautotrophicum]|uniref:PadR family transcriptional regulator n=1 Tax=Desulfonatronum thioautotrophicum TaxID=617001 RepID=UPI000A5A6172|nr:PadR family transcriptional regulator [Desulfonatronum thioautotrophicum]
MYSVTQYIKKGFQMPREHSPKRLEHQDLLSGLIRLHVLHHAAEEEIYGLWMIEELAEHGYRLSPGTLYPMLHNMVRKGYLTSRTEKKGRITRKYYRATAKGLEGLAVAKERLRELVGETMPGGRQDGKKTASDASSFSPETETERATE